MEDKATLRKIKRKIKAKGNQRNRHLAKAALKANEPIPEDNKQLHSSAMNGMDKDKTRNTSFHQEQKEWIHEDTIFETREFIYEYTPLSPEVHHLLEWDTACWCFLSEGTLQECQEEMKNRHGKKRVIVKHWPNGTSTVLPEYQEMWDHQKKIRMQDRFLYLTKAWKEEKNFNSSTTEIESNTNYQDIIKLGKDVVPLILKELNRDPDWWFTALIKTTEEDPVPPEDRGNLNAMRWHWLNWADQQGYSYKDPIK